MDKILLRGKMRTLYDCSDGSSADIELTSTELKAQLKPDLTQIKNGDKVLVEYTVMKLLPDGVLEVGGELGILRCVDKEDIIAHFPSEPEKEKVEWPEKLNENLCDVKRVDIIKALNKLIDVVREMKEK